MGVYLIIFGTRGVTYSAGQGEFFCPNCGNSPYVMKRVRRFFTLYFIPLLPLDLLGEYVECRNCYGTYRPEILDIAPTASAQDIEAEFHAGIKRTMVLMCLADGVVDDEEVAAIQTIYGKITHKKISQEKIRTEIDTARQDGRGVREYLQSLAGVLNDPGKELIVKAAIMIAAADGEFQEEETTLLAEIAQALQMSSAHLNGVLASMSSD